MAQEFSLPSFAEWALGQPDLTVYTPEGEDYQTVSFTERVQLPESLQGSIHDEAQLVLQSIRHNLAA